MVGKSITEIYNKLNICGLRSIGYAIFLKGIFADSSGNG
jgi:hypothetical protein|tara:strand:- start:298 stop:414 length:117 start_codon:yes stop_codon:yes gene_type:complete